MSEMTDEEWVNSKCTGWVFDPTAHEIKLLAAEALAEGRRREREAMIEKIKDTAYDAWNDGLSSGHDLAPRRSFGQFWREYLTYKEGGECQK